MSTSGSRAAGNAGEQAVTAERCAAQLLCGDPVGSADEVTERLLAVQAQDPRGARLAVRARSAGLSAADVDSDLGPGCLPRRRGRRPRCHRRGYSARSTRCCSAGPRATPITGPHRHIVTTNGIFRPFALADSRAVATWTVTGGRVVLAPFADLDAPTQAALDADAADVTRFLGVAGQGGAGNK